MDSVLLRKRFASAAIIAQGLLVATSFGALAQFQPHKRVGTFFYCDDARTLGIAPPPECYGRGGNTSSGGIRGSGGPGNSRAAAGIAAGAAAAGIIGAIANSIASAAPAEPNPAMAALEAHQARKQAEEAELKVRARDLNEQGRQAAANDKDAEALRLFRIAHATAQRASDSHNSLIYYRNIHKIESRIAYRRALQLYESGKIADASKAFAKATYFAQSAQDEELAGRIRDHHGQLVREAANLPAAKRRDVMDTNRPCVSVNGQLMCQ